MSKKAVVWVLEAWMFDRPCGEQSWHPIRLAKSRALARLEQKRLTYLTSRIRKYIREAA